MIPKNYRRDVVGWVVLLVLCTGCAVGRVEPNGALQGWAFGRAKLESCVTIPPPPDVERPKEVCSKIAGGAASKTWAEGFGMLISAAGAAFAAYLAQ